MKKLLSGALVLGAFALAVPLAALAKDKAAATASPRFTLAFIKAAGPAQGALKGANGGVAEPLVAAAEAAAVSDDDRYAAAHLRLSLLALRAGASQPGGPVAERDYKAAVEALVANSVTPAEERGRMAYFRGVIAYRERKPAEAVVWFSRAREIGYSDPDLILALAQMRMDSGDIGGGAADVDATIKTIQASGRVAPESYYRLVVARAVDKNMKPLAVEWLRRWLAAYPRAQTWHDALTIYGLQQDSLVTLDKAQVLDLFRLLRQARALDQYGYEQYAQRATDAGLPDEARAVLAEARANGTLSGPAAAIHGKASTAPALATTARKSPIALGDEQAADGALGRGDYAKAVAQYRALLATGGVNADQVNTHLGIALALSGDKASARTAFAAVTGSPRADMAQFWIVWLDHPAVA